MGQVKVSYDNKLLIPGPSVEFRRVTERSPDGGVRRRYLRIALTGYLDATKGSPTADGGWQEDDGYPTDSSDVTADARTDNLVQKIRALDLLFRTDGLLFEITPANGGDPFQARPRWGELRVGPGSSPGLFNYADWSIEGEASLDSVRFGAYVSSDDPDDDGVEVEETWQLERADEVGRVYRLVHTVSSAGQRAYNDTGTVSVEAWENARTKVITRLGLDASRLISAGVLSLSGFQGYNRVRSEQVDAPGGRFTVTETWTGFDPLDKPTGLTAGVAIEEWSVETAVDPPTGISRATVSGTITGLEERHPTTDAVTVTRWANAALRAAGVTDSWAHGKAQAETGLTLHPRPLSSTVGRNRTTGVVTYSVAFDTRPAESQTEYLYESIVFDNVGGEDVYPRIPVPGRAAGPVIQSLGTKNEKLLTVSVETQVAFGYGVTPTKPTYNLATLALAYLGSTPGTFVVDRASERWAVKSGRYSAQATYLYQ